MRQAVKEVVSDVKDAVGEVIEQGVQSITSPQLTPQQLQQKQQEEQRQLAEARRKIDWYKKLAEEQKRVIEQNRQKEAQRVQNLKQEKQIDKVKIEAKKQQPLENPALRWAGKFEKKGSIGG